METGGSGRGSNNKDEPKVTTVQKIEHSNNKGEGKLTIAFDKNTFKVRRKST